MSLVNRTYTFTDDSTAYGSQVDSEIQNLVNTFNSLDAGSAPWDVVKAVNGSVTPLIADNAGGTNNVIEARVNGVAKTYVDGTGVLHAVSASISSVSSGSLTDGYITYSTAQINRPGAAIEIQYDGGTGESVRLFGNGSHPVTFASNGLITATGCSILGAPGLSGTSTNNNAAAGFVGEYIVSRVSGVAVGSSGTFSNITSIDLTAGDWEVTGVGALTINGATMANNPGLNLSQYSGNTTTDIADGDNLVQFAPGTAFAGTSVPAWRVSTAISTTIYLKGRVYFSGGPPTWSGRLSARRDR